MTHRNQPTLPVTLGQTKLPRRAAQSTRQIAMQFVDFADNTYGYMLHCHNAIHEDEGMMAMLMVME